MTRRGISVLEMFVAMAVLTVAGGIVAQVATWTLRQRASYDDRQRAMRTMENLLETARALPVSELNDAWAARVAPTADMLARWPQCTLVATVATEGTLKRVTLTISLDGKTSQSLTAWYAT